MRIHENIININNLVSPVQTHCDVKTLYVGKICFKSTQNCNFDIHIRTHKNYGATIREHCSFNRI